MTAVNTINLASIAWPPPAPIEVHIKGIVEPSVRLKWSQPSNDKNILGYKIY